MSNCLSTTGHTASGTIVVQNTGDDACSKAVSPTARFTVVWLTTHKHSKHISTSTQGIYMKLLCIASVQQPVLNCFADSETALYSQALPVCCFVPSGL